MFTTARNIALVATTLFVVAPHSAIAVPVTYNLVSGSVDSVFLFTQGNLIDNCTGLGYGGLAGNCLAGEPLAIDIASITLDTDTGELIDLQIAVSGTGKIAMAGVNGYETVLFTGTTFSTTGTSALTNGSDANPLLRLFDDAFATIEVDQLDLELAAGLGGGWLQFPDYVAATSPQGQLHFAPGEVAVTLSGVELGVFQDPFGGADVVLEASFSFLAAAATPVPEPGAVILFGLGFFVVAAATRRESRKLSIIA